jgi:hypothetical protein
MSKFIRKPDGLLDLVEDDDDDDVLRDGERRHFMTFKDSAELSDDLRHAVDATVEAMRDGGGPALVNNGMGERGGSRPGYVFSGAPAAMATLDTAADAAATALEEMIADVGKAWQPPPRNKRERKERAAAEASRQEPQSLSDAERMRQEAFDGYLNHIENAWK